MSLHYYRIARNNMRALLANADTFSAAYINKQLAAHAAAVIGHGVDTATMRCFNALPTRRVYRVSKGPWLPYSPDNVRDAIEWCVNNGVDFSVEFETQQVQA